MDHFMLSNHNMGTSIFLQLPPAVNVWLVLVPSLCLLNMIGQHLTKEDGTRPFPTGRSSLAEMRAQCRNSAIPR